MSDLADMKNLGEQTARWLNDAGIQTAEQLAEIGAAQAWLRVKHIHPHMNLTGLYALQAALLDIHWNALPEDMKADLRRAVGRE